jgi:hypothetical protein
MWEPRRLTTIWASAACYKDSFAFFTSGLVPPAVSSIRHYLQTASPFHKYKTQCSQIDIHINLWSSSITDLLPLRKNRHSYWRGLAQAVSSRLPTTAARVRARVSSCGICGGQKGTGPSFLRVLQFPLPILIPPTAPKSPPSIIWSCTIGQLRPQYQVDSVVSPH